MAPLDPNRTAVLTVARKLGHLRTRVAFVGGASVGLLLTDAAAPSPRPTDDVDVIVEVATLGEYSNALRNDLLALGFREDPDAKVTCRWVVDDVIVDVMPTKESVLGLKNRWYSAAITRAEDHELEPGLSIRVVTAPDLVAMKIEAFHDRGNRDYLLSKDLEDIVALVDGRPGLVSEIASADAELREYISSEIAKFLNIRDFVDGLPAKLPPDEASQARLEIVLERLRAIAGH